MTIDDYTSISRETTIGANTTIGKYGQWGSRIKIREHRIFSDYLNIAYGCEFGDEVDIGAYTHIKREVVIGDLVAIHPRVSIGENCTIGTGTKLGSGVRIEDHCAMKPSSTSAAF